MWTSLSAIAASLAIDGSVKSSSNVDLDEQRVRKTLYAPAMDHLRHEFTVAIEAADIDFVGHVNNSVYLKWVTSAVIEHWKKIADPEAIAAHVWVALKHEITYRKPAFLTDEIVATTRLEDVRRESAFYETVIRRGEEILAHIKSRWCCLDAATLRPTRVGGDIVKRFMGISPSVSAVAL